MEKTRMQHARTCVYNVNYHIVWSVKYRRPVLEGSIESYLKELLIQISHEKGFVMQTMEVMPDHVHVFASAHPKISPSYMVKMLKGISGRKLLMRFPELKGDCGRDTCGTRLVSVYKFWHYRSNKWIG